jgi:malonyl-CoA/methylmalonyl-CoA synthetase
VLNLSKILSLNIKERLSFKDNLQGQKIGVYCSNNYSYLISILAIWMLNGVPFCLSKLYPPNLIDYYLKDSQSKLVINSFDAEHSNSVNSNEFEAMLKRNQIIDLKLNEAHFYLNMHEKDSNETYESFISRLNENQSSNECFLLYTSGTSGPPKGCIITYENLFSSIETMIETYKWTEKDFILNPLPLNHYSGLVYGLLTPFFVGAQCKLLPKFNAEQAWGYLLSEQNKLNVFIAVPTIYTQLVNFYNAHFDKKYNQEEVKRILKKKFRLIASGSAPLSVKTYDDWLKLTNYELIERYGMTEIGMALSNPYGNTQGKILRGNVGRPVGKGKCRLMDVENRVLIESDKTNDRVNKSVTGENSIFGELQIKGPMVFKEYLGKPKETKESFTDDGWFKTGET